MHLTFNPKEALTHKRLMFAEQIRGRNRSALFKKIRQQYAADEEIDSIIAALPATVGDLYHYCDKNRSREAYIATSIYHWLQNNHTRVYIDSKMSLIGWAFFLSICIQGYPDFPFDIFQATVVKIAAYQRYEGLRVTLTVLTAALKWSQNRPRMFAALQALIEKVQIRGCFKHWLTKQHLQFVLCFMPKSLPFTQSIALDQQFWNTINQCFDMSIESLPSLNIVISILIYISYHDQELYEGACQMMADKGIIQHLAFLLQFMEHHKWSPMLLKITTLLRNIACSIGSSSILAQGALGNLLSIIRDNQLSTPIMLQITDDCLHVMSYLTNDPETVDSLSQLDGISRGLQIIDKMGQQSPKIIESGRLFLQRMLEIGEQIRGPEEGNTMAIKLLYAGAVEILTKFQQPYEDIILLITKCKMDD